MAAQSLQMQTEALRAKNQAARQEREARQAVPSWKRA